MLKSIIGKFKSIMGSGLLQYYKESGDSQAVFEAVKQSQKTITVQEKNASEILACFVCENFNASVLLLLTLRTNVMVLTLNRLIFANQFA